VRSGAGTRALVAGRGRVTSLARGSRAESSCATSVSEGRSAIAVVGTGTDEATRIGVPLLAVGHTYAAAAALDPSSNTSENAIRGMRSGAWSASGSDGDGLTLWASGLTATGTIETACGCSGVEASSRIAARISRAL
jgi:hypothetical protein